MKAYEEKGLAQQGLLIASMPATAQESAIPLSPEKSETQSESANHKRILLIFALKSGQKRNKGGARRKPISAGGFPSALGTSAKGRMSRLLLH